MVLRARFAREHFAREKDAIAAHRASLRSGSLPPPAQGARGTLVHGFLLPFSLIAATLRDPALRGPYLRLTGARAAAVAALVALAHGTGGLL